jgi:hypothetical protein
MYYCPIKKLSNASQAVAPREGPFFVDKAAMK